ncbi:MAG: ATP-dependent DNA ligase [Myxococcota bacterium]
MNLPVLPPIEPMLANLADAIPAAGDFLFEPKWDGFRALVFKDGDEVYIQSRDLRPLDRYFPELVTALRANLPARVVLDGEIVIKGPRGLDFETLQLRLHPAASRVQKLAKETPASFVAFDILALGDDDLRSLPQRERRLRLEAALAAARPPIHLTPATRDRQVAEDWFRRFEGAGFDGVVAKEGHAPYLAGKRVMFKVKHQRTADCVVAGFRWHKGGEGTRVGSLLLGLFDATGRLHHVGVTAAFTMAVRKSLVAELAPLREDAMANHPWKEWGEWAAAYAEGHGGRMPGMQSRWSQGKDLSWEPLRVERVCEVKYDHLQGDRFRHAAHFLRWRGDKSPADCTYAQLEVVAPAELDLVFGQR